MAARTFEQAVRASCLATPNHLPALLALLDDYCARNHIGDADRHDLHLIVEEACINVMTHAYSAGAPGPLSLQVEGKVRGSTRLIEITIEDRGTPFNPLDLPAPDQTGPVDDLPIGGLGVLLIRRLSDIQHYTYDPERGNVLTIAKFLTAAGRS